MNHSLLLIETIQDAIKTGKLSPDHVPVTDIKKCVNLELETHTSSFMDEQYALVKTVFSELCEGIEDGETDHDKMMYFLSGMKMTLLSISDAALSLANGAYWRMVHTKSLPDPEIEEIISFVDKKHSIRLLNYDFIDDYMSRLPKVCEDPECGMCYVLHNGFRMYFPEHMDKQRIASYYAMTIGEQDKRSPHCYEKEGYTVKDGDVIVDVGGAEGIFTLDRIDRIMKAYVFDADPRWLRAMEKTFAPFGDKVELHYGYVGDISDGKDNITLDDALNGIAVNYIKMDIEGYERGALKGATKLLKNATAIRCAICSYHQNGDETWITQFLKETGFQTDHSSGYMCPDWCSDGLLKAELRRGVIFGQKDA